MTSKEVWRSNFRISIECTRCGADFICDSPIVSPVKMPGMHARTVTVYAPESCPECHSLHALDHSGDREVRSERPTPGLVLVPSPEAS